MEQDMESYKRISHSQIVLVFLSWRYLSTRNSSIKCNDFTSRPTLSIIINSVMRYLSKTFSTLIDQISVLLPFNTNDCSVWWRNTFTVQNWDNIREISLNLNNLEAERFTSSLGDWHRKWKFHHNIRFMVFPFGFNACWVDYIQKWISSGMCLGNNFQSSHFMWNFRRF